MDVHAVLEVIGEVFSRRAGIYEYRSCWRGKAGNKQRRVDASRY